jgi:transcriptional regulator with XRE-family HTH domain
MENSVDPIYEEIGRRIFEARDRKGLTQDQLAKKISLKRTSITNIEKGRQQLLVHMLIKIAKELEVDIESLIPKAANENANRIYDKKYPKKSLNWVKSALSKVEE